MAGLTGEEASGGGKSGERLSVSDVRAILNASGLPRAPGLDLPAIFAATTAVESRGDTNAYGDKDLGGAYGLWQVNAQQHPALADRVRAIIAAHLPAHESARRQALALAPLMRSAVAVGLDAARTLERRGLIVSEEMVAGLIDAAWQHSPTGLIHWAETTATGALKDFHHRLDEFYAAYRMLKDVAEFTGLVIGGLVLGGFAVILWLMRSREGYS